MYRITRTSTICLERRGRKFYTAIENYIPEIMKDFRVFYALAAWLFSGYMIVAAVMTPIAGKLSDIYGKKKYCSHCLSSMLLRQQLEGLQITFHFCL